MRKAHSTIGFLVLAWCTSSCAADAVIPAAENDAPASKWSYFGDVVLREDHVSGIPRAADTIQRVLGRGRIGVLFDPIPDLQFGVALKLAAASTPNRDDVLDNDNQRSNAAAFDQFFLRWRLSDDASVLLGKTPFPLELTPMLWDRELRPIGASAAISAAAGELNRFSLVGGYFAGDHLYDDDSRIAAIQAGYHWHEGAPVNGSALFSYLDYSSLDRLSSLGLARTNLRVGGRLVSEFHLLDLQLVARARPYDWPLEARLDLVHNNGADKDADGARFSLVLGDSRQPKNWELGLADQRIQRDAVMASFNSSDWWFHSAMRGVMPWVGYGFDSTWSMRLAGFHEVRDGLTEHTDRVLLDFYARW